MDALTTKMNITLKAAVTVLTLRKDDAAEDGGEHDGDDSRRLPVGTRHLLEDNASRSDCYADQHADQPVLHLILRLPELQ